MILDPRAKLYLLLLANLLLFFHASLIAETLLVAMLMILPLAAGRYASFIRLGVAYALLLAGTWVAASGDGNVWLHALGLVCVGVRMMMPCLIAGVYAFTTTSPGEFVCAMRRMRVPESVVIPCVVCIRFFPTIHGDYRQIRNAMALRGIVQGPVALLRHPAQSLEYILMPLLMNAANVAQDLSVAALTKGLGVPGEHTSRVRIRMRWFDWAWMLACTLPLALNMGGML